MVTYRLRELEEAGLVRREAVSDRLIAVAYEITEFGETALAYLESLEDWAKKNQI